MFLATKDGIICDLCGTIYKDEFVYYAVAASKISLVSNMRSGAPSSVLSADLCTPCYDKMLDQVRANLGPHSRKSIKCDLSKQRKTGTFDYYRLIFDHIDVNRNREPDVKVEKNVMDLTLIDKFNELSKKIEVTKSKMQQQEGMWS
jgi:hypothetical protein